MRYEDHIGLWKRELSNWLPNQIFDAHTHLSPPGIMRQLTAARLREPLTTFTSNTWHQLTEAYANVFNGKEVLGVIGFPFPLREVDIARANDYIVDLMCSESRLRGFILAHPEDSQETIRQFHKAEKRGVRFAGVKPYFDLLGKSNYATRMPEFIPEGLLDFMNSERLVIFCLLRYSNSSSAKNIFE